MCLAASCNKEDLTPADACSGLFTVAPGKQVYFSKGNLQARMLVNRLGIWRFANEQYESFRCFDHHINSSSNTDLYSWSTENSLYGGGKIINKTGAHTPYDHTGSFVDWGVNFPDDNWRTLSIAEWEYLFSYDSKANSTRRGLYAYDVTVAGVAGCVILYPDKYRGMKVLSHDTKTYNDPDKWHAAEKKGVVCLPPTGFIPSDKINVINVEHGNYWSSSASSDLKAEAFFFSPEKGPFSGKTEGDWTEDRAVGNAVRLVRNADGTKPESSKPYTPPTYNCEFVYIGNLEPVGSQYTVSRDSFGDGIVAYNNDQKKVLKTNNTSLTVEFLNGAEDYFTYQSYPASEYGSEGLYYCFKAKDDAPDEGRTGYVRLSFEDLTVKFTSTIQLVLPETAQGCFVNINGLKPLEDEYTVSKESGTGIGIIAYDVKGKKVLKTDEGSLTVEFLGDAAAFFEMETFSAGGNGYQGNYYSFKAKSGTPFDLDGYVLLTYNDGTFHFEQTLYLVYPGPKDKFSVSSSKKVCFPIQGNVVLMTVPGLDKVDSDLWKCASHQYSTGNGHNGVITESSSTWIDRVPWANWGSKVGDSSLRALTIEEWHYLVNYGDQKNSTREGLIAYGVTVVGVPNCVIIYPDGYKGKIVKDNDKTTYSSKSAWEAAEEEYVVCLPPYSSDTYGGYWSSSSAGGNKTYIFSWCNSQIYGNGVYTIDNSDRLCVRLVKNAN